MCVKNKKKIDNQMLSNPILLGACVWIKIKSYWGMCVKKKKVDNQMLSNPILLGHVCEEKR